MCCLVIFEYKLESPLTTNKVVIYKGFYSRAETASGFVLESKVYQTNGLLRILKEFKSASSVSTVWSSEIKCSNTES